MRAREIIKALEKAGFVFIKANGSHQKYRHSDGRWTTVPVHSGDVPPGTLRDIEKQTKLKFK